MKFVGIILAISNIILVWLLLGANPLSETKNDHVCKALLPFYLRHFAQSVDVHKLLDAEKIPYDRNGSVLSAGKFQIEFDGNGVAKDVRIYPE
jgi:hypothetical protein